MRFYYLSLISLVLLAGFYFVALYVVRQIWKENLKRPFTGVGAWVAVAVVLVAPWSEELWIAYNFGQLCRKDAGIFINKTVEVEGFYDSSMRSAYENTKPGGYQFVEHATEGRKGIERVQRASDEERALALAWYSETNPGKGRPKGQSIFHPLNDRETVAVFPNGVDAWRITKLDQPTARYHFLQDQGTQITHKVGRQMSRIVDSESGQELGRYTTYYREPNWFFIGLDRPNMGCDGPDGGPNTKHPNSFLIYRDVLVPIVGKNK